MPPSSLWARSGSVTQERAEPVPPPRPPRPSPPPGQAGPGPPAARTDQRLRRAAVGWTLVLAGLLGALAVGQISREDERTQAAAPLLAPGGSGSESQSGRVYDRAAQAVASVRVGGGSGTGFLIDDRGTIVTNAHVVGESEAAEVRFGEGEPIDATVLGSDPSSDVAAMRVDPADLRGARPLQLADSDLVEVGDEVVAIGHPLGLDRTATAGIVSGLGREIQAPDGFQIDEVIQTDAPINPGNSGGPLLDDRGAVIGVNSQIATAGARGSIGIGFAVPANAVREVLPQLARGERVVRPYLGLTSSPAPAGGARAEAVESGGPADLAGLSAGDVVVSVDGEDVRAPGDVASAIADRQPGDRIDVEVERAGDLEQLAVTLGTRPERSP